MVKNNLISATKANNLYWLGRYEERVYVTMHLFSKCYDGMLDGEGGNYAELLGKLDLSGAYRSHEDFVTGMIYDEDNPCSVMNAQLKAMDNAILLREDIMSETLSYLEMSVALMKECRERKELNIIHLQPIVDWSLAFWGAAEQRVQNHNVLYIMMMGRNIENLDMRIRFDYPYERIALAYESLKRYSEGMPRMIDDHIEKQMDELLKPRNFIQGDAEYKNKLLKFVNQMVRV